MNTNRLLLAMTVLGSLGAGSALACSSGSGAGSDSGVGQDAAADQAVAADSGAGQDSSGGQDTGAAQDSGGNPDGGGEGGMAVSCTDYCTTVLQACGASDGGPSNATQYYNTANCAATCALWQAGTFGDNADSVGCRQAQAHAALTDKTKCEAAGPGGGGICGSRCEDYCTMVMSHCTTANAAVPPYGSNADCLAACAAYPYDTAKLDYDQNAISHLNCLDYHLRESFATGKGQGIKGGHCDDLSIDGGTAKGACHP